MSRLLAFVLVFITHLSEASVMYGQTAVDLSGLRNEKTTKAEDKYLASIPGRVQANYGHKAEAAVFAVGTYSALASTIACGHCGGTMIINIATQTMTAQSTELMPVHLERPPSSVAVFWLCFMQPITSMLA